MNNQLSYYGLTNARMSASKKNTFIGADDKPCQQLGGGGVKNCRRIVIKFRRYPEILQTLFKDGPLSYL